MNKEKATKFTSFFDDVLGNLPSGPSTEGTTNDKPSSETVFTFTCEAYKNDQETPCPIYQHWYQPVPGNVWSGKCAKNKCACNNGNVVWASKCEAKVDGEQQCRSCNFGFSLVEGACVRG